MELLKTKYKIRCEMGACRNLAAHTVKMSRSGIKSQIHICESCLKELYSLMGSTLVPKSIETVKKSKARKATITAGELEKGTAQNEN